MITEQQYEQMLDALINQIRGWNGVLYILKLSMDDDDKWRPFVRSMLNSILIIGGIVIVGNDS